MKINKDYIRIYPDLEYHENKLDRIWIFKFLIIQFWIQPPLLYVDQYSIAN
jgi:hypothetical protein